RYERTVGYFVNPLPLRADLAGEPTFHELVLRVRDVVFGALEHQHFPLMNAIERSQRTSDPRQIALFQCVFALERTHLAQFRKLTSIVLGEPGTADLAGLAIRAFAVERTGTHFDLALRLSEGGRGTLEFNTDIFDRSSIEQLARGFEALV